MGDDTFHLIFEGPSYGERSRLELPNFSVEGQEMEGLEKLPAMWNPTFRLRAFKYTVCGVQKMGRPVSLPGHYIFRHWSAPWEPGWLRGGAILKGSIHNSDLHLDQMTFMVLSSTWGFTILFLLGTKAEYVSHCLNRILRMDKSAVWNVGGASIYFVFQFLEAVFVFEAVWSLTFCNIWSTATVFVYCKEHGKTDFLTVLCRV